MLDTVVNGISMKKIELDNKIISEAFMFCFIKALALNDILWNGCNYILRFCIDYDKLGYEFVTDADCLYECFLDKLAEEKIEIKSLGVEYYESTVMVKVVF